MMPAILHRLLTHKNTKTLLYLRSISTQSQPGPTIPTRPEPNPRTRTPLEKQFELWLDQLRPGFTTADVTRTLTSQPDPDLALDIFRWTAQQRGYKHDHVTYLTMIKIAAVNKRFGHAETLIEEIIAGACDSVSIELYNSVIRFCIGRKFLFNRAFDVYKKMVKSEDCKPNLETYSLLLNSLLKRFNKLNVCYVYLHAVRSLTKQMKASGVIPDTFTLNMMIKAYSKCGELEEAIRVFREMGLYGCEANAYTYSYISKGLCEKGRVDQGWGFYKEMRAKGLVPTGSTFMILVCSLSMEQRFGDAVDVMYDMLRQSKAPDMLTYKTLLECMCRGGKCDDAFEVLEELKKRDRLMPHKTYKTLLDRLHVNSRE